MALVFALVSVAGAWTAWHHDPRHVGQSGLRVLVAILLLIAAAVLAIVTTVKYTQGLSMAMQLILMGILIVALVFGMVFSVKAVASPKSARLTTTLPPSAKVLTIHRDHLYAWVKFVVGFFAVCGAGLLIPGNVKYAFVGLGGIALMLAVILLPLLYINARNKDRALTGLELNPWVHWQYSTAQWQEWSAVQAARLKELPTFSLKHSWRKLIEPFVVIAGGVMLFSSLSWRENLFIVLASCGTILGMLELSVWAARRAPEKFEAKLRAVAPEVFMGRDGLFCNGRFLTWFGEDYYLTVAAMDSRPPHSLVFRFEKIVPNPYGAPQTVVVIQSVLIPAGGDGDIAGLHLKLVARCPSARISFT
jgi:hypothetical protein